MVEPQRSGGKGKLLYGLLYLKTQEGGAPLRILKITHFKYTRPREAKTNWCQTYLVISRGGKRLKMIKEKKKSRNKIHKLNSN